MKKTFSVLSLLLIGTGFCAGAQNLGDNLDSRASESTPASTKSAKNGVVPDADNAGLKMPAGFGALKIADGLGITRHIAVTAQGDVYVKMKGRVVPGGRGILKLHDANGDGKSDETTGIANYSGTGIVIK